MTRSASCARRALRLCVFAAAASLVGLSLQTAAHAQTAHPLSGQVTTYTGAPSYTFGIYSDGAGNIYTDAHTTTVINKGTLSGGVYTYTTLFSGTPLVEPSQITRDASGNFYIANGSGGNIVKLTLSGGTYTASTIANVGSGYVFGVAVDAAGNVFYTLTTFANNGGLYEISPSGATYTAPVTLSSTLNNCYGVSLAANGNLYVGNYGANNIVVLTKTGATYVQSVLPIAGLSIPEGAVVDASGNLYITDVGNSAFVEEVFNGGTYTRKVLASSSGEGYPTIDSTGTIYFTGSTALAKVLPAGTVFGATAVNTASMQLPVNFNIDTTGTLGAFQVLTQGAANLDFTLGTGSTCTGAATGPCVVNVIFTPKAPGQRLGAVNLTDSSGNVIATAYIGGTGSGPLATLSPGLISTVAGNGTQCVTPTASPACGDGTAAATATLYSPQTVAVDGAGNLYIADEYDQRIRKVTAATGFISTVAGNGTGTYVASQDTGTTAATAASLQYPTGITVDGAGNLYIADTSNQRIRKVTASTGFISTVAGNGTTCATPTASPACGDGAAATAASLSNPTGVAVDGAGNLYIADSANNRIRKVTAATGFISTLAGNGTQGYTASQDTGTTAATATSIFHPYGVAVDGAGNLYIADLYNQRIRKVTASTGLISTVAGNGGNGGYTASQDTGTTAATAASLNYPEGVAVDGAGNLYIADQSNQRIRKVTAATGFISTVAGNGTATYVASQDTGTTAATTASLSYPQGVAVDGAGNLFIVDQYNNRIRKVSVTGDIIFPTATAAGTSDTTDGTQTVIVNNIGNLPLVFTSQVETGSSFVLGNPMTGGCVANGTVAAGGSCLIGAMFAPVAGTSGAVAGSVTLTDNSLNATAATQGFPLIGSTTANTVSVSVSNANAMTGAASVTLQYIYGQSGSVGDTGALTITVNGSATGVGASTCTNKGSHRNCTFPYTGAALGAPGTYTISVAIAADATYAATTGTGTLAVTALGLALPGPPVGFARTPLAPVSVQQPVSTVVPASLGTVLQSADALADTPDADSTATACTDEAKAAATRRGNAKADCAK